MSSTIIHIVKFRGSVISEIKACINYHLTSYELLFLLPRTDEVNIFRQLSILWSSKILLGEWLKCIVYLQRK